MIEDDVLREVRAAREAFARLHDFDLEAMAAELQRLDLQGDWPVVRHAPRRPRQVEVTLNVPIEAIQPTSAA